MLARVATTKEASPKKAAKPARQNSTGYFALEQEPAEAFTPPKFSWSIGNIAMSAPGDNGRPDQGENGTPGGPAWHFARPLLWPIQAKLEVGAVDDPLEREADRVAEHVMRMPEPIAAAGPGSEAVSPHSTSAGLAVQRKCGCGGTCEKCQAEQQDDKPSNIQRKPAAPQISNLGASPASAGMTSPPIVHEVLRSPGQPLDAGTRAFLEPHFGEELLRVRLHSDPLAERSAHELNARAYTVGNDIVFGAGQYVPGTHDGRRLLVHELAHVVQQSGESYMIQRSPEPHPWPDKRWKQDEKAARYRGVLVADRIRRHGKLSEDAHARIRNELAYFEDGAKDAYIAQVRPALQKVGRLDVLTEDQPQSPKPITLTPLEDDPHLCGGEACKTDEDLGIAAPPKPEWADFCYLPKGTMEWRFGPPEEVSKITKKRKMQIKFTPMPSYRDKLVTFLQTFTEQGAGSASATVDIGINQQAFDPFYGIDPERGRWRTEKMQPPQGYKTQPSSASDPSAYMYDEPFYFPPPHARLFESAAVVPETGETLGVLRWGVGEVPGDARSPQCSERPTPSHEKAVEKFYTPKMEGGATSGEENYNVVFDSFEPDDASLTPEQKAQLSTVAERAKKLAAQTDQFQVVVAGFGDAGDHDADAASKKRAEAVANEIMGSGIAKDKVVIWGMGATWARYELNSKEAKAGRNRRIQARLFDER
jgi:outer membrane protein OmpA-like peptidoglycan-associated protein